MTATPSGDASDDGSSDAAEGRRPTDDAAATVERARERIDRLAVGDGEFAVACRDAGVSPAPVTGSSFETYEAAERARDAALEYRDAMRTLDPGLAEYDLAVCAAGEADVEVSTVRQRTGDRRENGLPEASKTVTVASDRSDEWIRIDGGPVVHLRGPDSPLADEVVARQLRTKL